MLPLRHSGADVIAEILDQTAHCSAMAEPAPPAIPYCFMSKDMFAAVVVDEPDLVAPIDFQAGVGLALLADEEPAPVIADDPDHLVYVLGSAAASG